MLVKRRSWLGLWGESNGSVQLSGDNGAASVLAYSAKDEAMTLRNLQDSLAGLASFADATGEKKGAAALRALSRLLDGKDDTPAETAIMGVSALVEEYKSGIIHTYIARLSAAAASSGEFEPVFAGLRADKLAGKDDIDKIAHGYTGARRKYISRQAALDAIRGHFEERACQAGKMQSAERHKAA
jgi:hypothetical protein